MKDHAAEYSIEKMAVILEVSRSGYYDFINRVPSKRTIENEILKKEIIEIYMASRRVYGSRKITKEINKHRIKPVNHKRVARLMKELRLQSKVRKKYVITTDSKHDVPLVEDLLKRNFKAMAKNKKWVSDTTYLYTGEGWLYIAVVLDLYGRRVVGLSTSRNNDKDLVKEALQDAINRSGKKRFKGCILHSDRGSTYCSTEYLEMIDKYSFQRSNSRKGNCWDNAPMESFFGKMKMEWFDEPPNTREEANYLVYEYVWSFYNRQRTHASNNYMTPEEYYSQPDTAA